MKPNARVSAVGVSERYFQQIVFIFPTWVLNELRNKMKSKDDVKNINVMLTEAEWGDTAECESQQGLYLHPR